MGSIITLTTDFGVTDGYPGVLEGVIGGINPHARIVTISHGVPPGNIVGGWYLLKTHYHYFPPGTVHLAVVDPGVGTRRKIVTVRTRRHTFVAPDNGLLSFLPQSDILSIHAITNRKYALGVISPVFHGRDIMAPAAAYVSLGIDPSCLGRACRKLVDLPGVSPAKHGRKWLGKILWVDRFGNLISSVTSRQCTGRKSVVVNGVSIGPIRSTFGDVLSGQPLAYIGSGGHLEIAVRDGSARDYFAVDCGQIEIQVASS